MCYLLAGASKPKFPEIVVVYILLNMSVYRSVDAGTISEMNGLDFVFNLGDSRDARVDCRACAIGVSSTRLCEATKICAACSSPRSRSSMVILKFLEASAVCDCVSELILDFCDLYFSGIKVSIRRSFGSDGPRDSTGDSFVCLVSCC